MALKNIKYLILGAGPAGLTIGRCLKDKGENNFIIVEKEAEAGGLCRSVKVDGSPFDIGGGHFLDAKNKAVCDFIFRFMPENEWERFKRDSRILIHDMEISHPFEANLWQLPNKLRDEYVNSIRLSGCNTKKEMPLKFTDWIRWKLGDMIADNYMLPYNRKLFANELNELGTYWLNKLPSVNLEETLKSIKENKSYGTEPGHADFFYPKHYGYGEVFLRIADSMKNNIIYDNSVINMNLSERKVILKDGTEISADTVITTIPWKSMQISGTQDEFLNEVYKLKATPIETVYVSENIKTDAHWLYIPDEDKPYHRILCRHNFATGSRGYWTESRNKTKTDGFSYFNEYAYPLNTIDKPQTISYILTEAGRNKVIGLGRWGEHEHYNSDFVIDRALKLSKELS